MFKTAEWTSSRLVPTSDAAKFLMKGASVIADVFGRRPDRRYARPGDEVVIGQTSAEAVRLSRRQSQPGTWWTRVESNHQPVD